MRVRTLLSGAVYSVAVTASLCTAALAQDSRLAGIWLPDAGRSQRMPPNPPYTPEGRRIVDEWQASHDPIADDPGAFCQAPGMPSLALGGADYPLEVVVTAEQITILMELHQQIRRIYMTAEHPERPFPQRNGHSIGRWEGETLIVDTSAIRAITFGAVPHSDRVQVIERWNVGDDGASLVNELTIRDPVMYAEEISLRQAYTRAEPGTRMLEYECTEGMWEDHERERERRQATAAASAAQGPAEPPTPESVAAGEFVVEPATLIALGFEWYVAGDENRDAEVSVRYRRSGDTVWREGMPLLRLFGERMPDNYGAYDYVVPNGFAGSIIDLKPDTDYDVALRLSDPDGAYGDTEKTMTLRTRAEPEPFAGGRVFHVYPPGYQGEREQPAFTGLLAAYYTRANGADWFNAYPPRVEPGDTILVHGGLYQEDRFRYANSLGLLFDGTYRLRQSGTAERPIAIRAAGDGEPIFDGNGNHILFDVTGADYLYFEGLTIRNTEVAIQAGYKGLGGAVGLTVKSTRFEDVGRGIYTDWSGSKDFYIADNVFIGKSHPDRLEGWIGSVWQGTPGFPTPVISELAVKVYGSGHVIAHNYVANFHDGIDHATYGAPDGNPDVIRERMPVAIDIYNNDISNVDDNCIEADGAMHNVRILRNRCFNQGHRSLSTQPILGGPAYFIGNVVYHAPEGGSVKFTANSAGLVVYHNTFTSEVLAMGPAANQHYRNNLILGQGAADKVFAVETTTNYSSSDYNGFRPNPDAEYSFGWRSPDFGTLVGYDGLIARDYASLAAYSRDSGNDTHSVLVDYDVFVNVPPLDLSNPWNLHDPADVDFRLRPDSAAIDAGVALPGVNDDATGSAPDLGAYEYGAPLPVYGPRTAAR